MAAATETEASDLDPHGDERDGALDEMPLLDAVQTLVEKERALMELKVNEATDEINAWKEKYHALAQSTNQLSDLNKDIILPDPKRESHWNRLRKAKGEGDISNLKFIDLSRERLDCSHLPFLARRMPKVAALPQLSLAHNELTDSVEGAKGLSRLLDTANFVYLDLSHNQLGPLMIIALFGSFAKNRQPKLHRLHLDGNWQLAGTLGMGEQIGSALIKCASVMPRLKALRLTLSDDAPNKASPLYEIMKSKANNRVEPAEKLFKQKGVTLSTHGMSGKIVKPRKPYNAHEFLKKFNADGFPSINDLALVGARLSRDSVLEISKLLKDPKCSLTSLDLTYAQIGPMGCKVLANALARAATRLPAHVQHDISLNEEDDEEEEARLKEYVGIIDRPLIPGLISLCLAHCGIASSGCQYLCRALKKSDSLTRLDLRSNGISDVGALELANLIHQPPPPPSSSSSTARRHDSSSSETNQHHNTHKKKRHHAPPPSVLAYLDIGDNMMGKMGMEAIFKAANTCNAAHGCKLLMLKGCDDASASSMPILKLAEVERNLLKKRASLIKTACLEVVNSHASLVKANRCFMTEVATLTAPKLPKLSSASSVATGHPPQTRLLVRGKLRRSDGGPFIWRLVLVFPFTTSGGGGDTMRVSMNRDQSKEHGENNLSNQENENFDEEVHHGDRHTAAPPQPHFQTIVMSTGTSHDVSHEQAWSSQNVVIPFYPLVASTTVEFLKTKWHKKRQEVEVKLEVCATDHHYNKLSKVQISQLPPGVSIICEDLQCLWSHNTRDLIPLSTSGGGVGTRDRLSQNQSSTIRTNNSALHSSPAFNLNFGRSFHYQDNIEVYSEKIDEPIKQAMRVANSGCITSSEYNDKSSEDLRSISNSLISQLVATSSNSNYHTLAGGGGGGALSSYHDKIDHHLWTHLNRPSSHDTKEFEKELNVLCSLLITHEIFFNGMKSRMEESDIVCIRCVRRMVMSFSSLSSSVAFQLKLSPKTAGAAREVSLFEMVAMTERDGKYELLGHVTSSVQGCDLWNWITIESMLRVPNSPSPPSSRVFKHDNVSLWVWTRGTGAFIPMQEMDIEIRLLKLSADQCATPNSSLKNSGGGGGVSNEGFFCYEEAQENAKVRAQLHFASTFPLNYSKSGATWA